MDREDVVVVGSHVQGLFMHVPHYPQADETVLGWGFKEALDGGKGSHQAIACGRLGLRTHFVGRVGQDRLGQIGVSWLADAGVDITYLFRSTEVATGCGFVLIDPKGIPAMTTAMGANEEFTEADVDRAETLLKSAKLVLITFEIPIATALYAGRRAKDLGAFTILTPGPAEILPCGALDWVDLLVPNEIEAKALLGYAADRTIGLRELAMNLQEYSGAGRLIITLGDRGAFVLDGDESQTIQAFKVNVVDTPGAGDAFTSGVAYGLFRGASLVDAARFGCLTAARAVTIKESVPGFATPAELERFAKQNKFEIPEALRIA